MINNYRYFFQSNFPGLGRLFPLVYSNEDDNAKSVNVKDIIYKKVLSKIITS